MAKKAVVHIRNETFSSVTQSCPILCNPMNRSMPGLPVHHQLLEFTQTHVHQVRDVIQPSHPLSSPSPPSPQSLPAPESFPMSQLFTWDGQSTGVSALASFFPKNTQDWFPLQWTSWISLQSKGLSRVFSNTTVQKHQFFSAAAAAAAAAAAKSLQSCPTLCNPIDGSPIGSPVPGILQARILEWVNSSLVDAKCLDLFRVSFWSCFSFLIQTQTWCIIDWIWNTKG